MKLKKNTQDTIKITLENNEEVKNAIAAAARAEHFGPLMEPATAAISVRLYENPISNVMAEIDIIDVSTTNSTGA